MRIIGLIVAFFILVCIVSCASDYKRPPSGGPEDRISPRVVSSSIAHNSLNMPSNVTLSINFSKFIDRNSGRNAIHISPRSAASRSRVLWYDKSVKIIFRELEEDRTVGISVGTSLKDIRGNPLVEPYALSFSTGDRIDRKSVRGKIDGAISKNEPVRIDHTRLRVNLYDASSGEKIDFGRIEPEYSASVSKNYEFTLGNLSGGVYQLIVFNDLNNDARPQFDNEMISHPEKLTDLVDNDSLSYGFTLGWNHDRSPVIEDVSFPGREMVKISFNEDIRRESGKVDSILVNDVITGFTEYFTDTDSKTIYLNIRNELKNGDRMDIFLKDIQDIYGNHIDDQMKKKTEYITGDFKKAPFDLTKRIPQRISTDRVLFIHTNRFINDSLQTLLMSVTDSVYTKLTPFEATEPFMQRYDLSEKGIAPGDHELHLKWSEGETRKYRLKLDEPEGSGHISGKLTDIENKQYILIFKNVENNENFTISSNDGPYKKELKPGKYICAAFEKLEGSDVFRYDIYRSKTVQNVVFFPDTVLVRRNWESTDVDFNFNIYREL